MKRYLLIISFLLIAAFVCACSTYSTYKITTDNDSVYFVKNNSADDGSLYVKGINIYKASSNELRKISTDNLIGNNVIISEEKSAALVGASILNDFYENWTENNSVAICYNSNAEAWIIHGQLKDRNSIGCIGLVAIDSETGEILCLYYGQ